MNLFILRAFARCVPLAGYSEHLLVLPCIDKNLKIQAVFGELRLG